MRERGELKVHLHDSEANRVSVAHVQPPGLQGVPGGLSPLRGVDPLLEHEVEEGVGGVVVVAAVA